MLSARLRRVARNAGARPNRSPVSRVTPAENASTFQLGEKCRSELRMLALAMAETPHHAHSTPTAPPAADSARLSTRSCRISRPRVAPMASRTAISRRRPLARESSRLATLAQAISSTRLVAMARTRSGSVISLRLLEGSAAPGASVICCSRNLRRRPPAFTAASLTASAACGHSTCMAACALPAGTPGLSRAIVVSQNMLGVFHARVAAGLTTGNMVSGINASASWPL